MAESDNDNAAQGGLEVPVVLHAWVDESMQLLPDSTRVYLLSAIVADVDRCEDIRDQVRPLKLKGDRKLHWRDESPARQRKIAAVVADVGALLVATKQERARRTCMQRLLVELDATVVTKVWVEHRTTSLNRKDSDTLQHLRAVQGISRRLRVEFLHGNGEPMPWLSDAVAGSVGLARRGQPECRNILASCVSEIEVVVT